MTQNSKQMPDFQLDAEGKLPWYDWNITFYYLDEDNHILCATEANKLLSEGGKIVAQKVHGEGSPLICSRSGVEIHSEYGIPDAPEYLEIQKEDEEERYFREDF